MNWLTRVLAPALAFACVLAIYLAAASPASPPIKTSMDTASAPVKTTTALDQAASDPPVPTPKGLLSDWRPDVDQAIDQLERWLSEDHPQQELNYSMANLAALYDTKLYLVFIDYLASLAPEQSGKILQEQQLWLQMRKERTAAARLTYAEGTLASYNASETYVYLTHERIDTLTSLMHNAAP